MVRCDDRGHPADCAAADAGGRLRHPDRPQGLGCDQPAQGPQRGRPVRPAAELCRRSEGVPAGNHHPERGEQGHFHHRPDHHLHGGTGGVGGGAVRGWSGAGGYQCRPAVHPRDQFAVGLRRGDGRVGLELEIPVLLRHACRCADDLVRGLDRLHPRVRRALGRFVEPDRDRRGAARPRFRHRQRVLFQPAAVPDVGGVLHQLARGNAARSVRPDRGGKRAGCRVSDRIFQHGLRALLAG